ncbi:hypothetical protein R5R35_011798 [Gryllus longicercus]|uniref:Piwi n=1 Tax=Gryllus longicercus TaxID=2509291 RepID=A0AAN9ZA37_9ORTH
MSDGVARARGRARARARTSQPAAPAARPGDVSPAPAPPVSAGPGFQRDRPPSAYQERPDDRAAYYDRQGDRAGYQQREADRPAYRERPAYQERSADRPAYQDRQGDRSGYQRQDDRSGHQEQVPTYQQPRGSSQNVGSRPYSRDPESAGKRGLTQRMQRLDIGVSSASAGGGDQPPSSRATATRGRRSAQSDIVRTRPAHVGSKRGSTGQRVMLTANYYKLETHTDWCLYQYRVDFSPDEDRTQIRKALLRNHRSSLGGYIFDGTVMFTSHRLTSEASRPMELVTKRQSDDEKVVITIRQVGDLALGDYHYLQFFNILMRKCLAHLNLQLVGRNFFDPKAKVEVREYKLELWPGYVTSIRQHENSILMCSEITHKVMRQDNVLDLLTECVKKGERDFQRIFQQAIIGSVVLTDYNNRTYRIDDVDFRVCPDSKFKLRSGQEISYKQYYREKYQINITQGDQPMLISRTKPRERRAGMSEMVYLVPELCRLTGLTDDMRANFNLMRALAEHTRVGPKMRVQKLLNFGRRLRSEESIMEDLQEWNMRLSENLVQFEGRVLPRERIIQGHSKYDPSQETDWTRDLRGQPMLTNPRLENWAVICPSRSKRDGQTFVASLIKAASGMHFTIPNPFMHEIQDDRAASYVDALERVISSKNPQLVMCIVPNNRSDRYSSIKKKCCVERAVPTQVILQKNLTSKGVMSIATKVAIQMNCKIGGAPWTLEIPLSGLMVVGFDVCHDTTSKGKSFGAVVASLDKTLSRYFSAVSPHTTGEELSNDLSINLCKALRKFMDYNDGHLPQRIVVYRDGVGEGQIPYVFQHEVTLMKEKLGQMYQKSGQELHMAFIIVTKRINTRIFLQDNNPPPGTVVDDCITMPERYDFFLVSQSVRQGTVSPTSYNVISDNLGLDPDKLQRLTYKLTHLYYNWSGTVRVPAPCQYAHKLAYLVGQALHRAPNAQLEDVLYFL